MKTFKRITAVLLVVIMVLSISGCGDKKSSTVKNDDGSKAQAWFAGAHSVLSDEPDYKEYFEGETVNIDVNGLYSSIKYTPDLFYGTYVLENYSDKKDKILKDYTVESITFDNGTFNMVVLPVAICSGSEYICGSTTTFSYSDYENIDCEIAVLKFATESGFGTVPCTYEIDGNKIRYTNIDKTSADGEEFAYKIGDVTFEYEFSFRGPDITLSRNGESMTLRAYSVTEASDRFEITGYSLPDSPLVGNMDFFCASQGGMDYACSRSGNYYDLLAIKLTDDGFASVIIKDKGYGEGEEDLAVEKQFIYFLQSEDFLFNRTSIVLYDGEKTYYYTDSITSREERQLDGADELSDDQIKEIAEKKADLYDDLQKEFEAQGINITINRAVGEISMDSSVLFGGDSADISAEGKEVINKFLAAYTKIIYNEKYNGFIEKTVIEGHTAPLATSTYESGLPLSTQRAENVKAYCLSGETGVDTSKLADTLEAVGLSNSKPIYDGDGNVDMDASRRVSFRFVINTDSVE